MANTGRKPKTINFSLVDSLILKCYHGTEIARDLNICPKTLYNAVMRNYGITFKEYYANIRNLYLQNYN